jgi:drug/metabolite transporter (DMT)-like permease
MKSPLKPARWQIVLILTIGVLTISTAAVLVRLALSTGPQSSVGFSLIMAALRMLMAAIMLIPTWPSLRRSQPPAAAIGYAAAAGVALALHFATWITSLSYTSIAASTTIVTTNPIWVALWAWWVWGDRPTKMTALGIGVALISGFYIGFDSANTPDRTAWIGNGLALMGAWAASSYLLLGREAQRHGLGVSGYVAVAYGTAAIVLLPLPLVAGMSYLGHSPLTYGYIALMALLPQLVGHTSFNWAMRWVAPTTVTLVILLEPVGASLLAFWWFGEVPGVRVLMGAVGLLVGVAIAVFNQRTA